MPREPRGYVEREFLTLPVWDALDPATAEQVARTVEQCLPEPWAFKRLAWYECGDQKRWVAFFDWNGSEFALIPGDVVTMGWDRGDRNQFDLAQIEAADRDIRSTFGNDNFGIWEWLNECLTRYRTVGIAPLLVEVRAVHLQLAHAQIVSAFAREGFRLPSVDEWEYVFGGSLWTPGEWLSWAAPLDLPEFVAHRPFGLRYTIDSDCPTYPIEYCAEPYQMRGGDGGATAGTGYDGLLGALPEAPAHDPGEWSRTAFSSPHSANLSRRVFPFPIDALA